MFEPERDDNSEPYIRAQAAINEREAAKNIRHAQAVEATTPRQPRVLTDAGDPPGPDATQQDIDAYEIRKRLVDNQADAGKMPVVRVRGRRVRR